MYLLLAIVFVIAVLIITGWIFNLKGEITDLKGNITSRKATIESQDVTIKKLRTQLTDSTDRVESLRIENTTQAKNLDELEKTIELFHQAELAVKQHVPESTQYPVAPPDLTQKKFGRDNKGHFIKKR